MSTAEDIADRGRDEAIVDAIAALGEGVRCSQPFAGSPPLFVEPLDPSIASDREVAVEWFRERSEELDEVAAAVGAYVLRGFPLRSPEDFAELTTHFPQMPLGYSGGATPREPVAGHVFEATQAPASVPIQPHQEMAYLRIHPSQLAFYCQSAPDSGGETVIGDVRRFQAGLPERFLRTLAEKGVTYHRHFNVGDSVYPCEQHPKIYHATLAQGFGTDDRGAIEAQLQSLGMEWDWLDDGSLSTHLSRPGFAVHPRTGERVYFNHLLTQIMDFDWLGESSDTYLDLYDRAGRPRPYHTTYGDGSEVDPEDHRRIVEGLVAVTVGFPWRAGDVMVIDNVYTAHGRKPYVGTRDLLVAMKGMGD